MLVDPFHWRCSDNMDLGRYITYSYLNILTAIEIDFKYIGRNFVVRNG